jgi:hypothetical protein
MTLGITGKPIYSGVTRLIGQVRLSGLDFITRPPMTGKFAQAHARQRVICKMICVAIDILLYCLSLLH